MVFVFFVFCVFLFIPSLKEGKNRPSTHIRTAQPTPTQIRSYADTLFCYTKPLLTRPRQLEL